MSQAAFSLLGFPQIATLERGQEVIRAGLPPDTVRALADRYRVSLETMGRLVGIPKATLTRKLRTKRRLEATEADRVYRLARIYAHASDAFDDEDLARAWFCQPNRALRGAKPIELLDTEIGVARIERLLEQIEHGVFT